MAEIAVAGAIAVLTQTVSILGNLAAEDGAHLSKLKEDIGWIEREMGYIHTYLRNADSIGEEHENTVEAALVKDIRVLAYDVEDIVETYSRLIAAKEESFSSLGRIRSATFGFLKRSYAVPNFVKEIEGIKKRVEDIPRVRETYGTKAVNDARRGMNIWEERKHFLNLNDSKIVGFDEHINTLVSKVIDLQFQHPRVISIVGMPGVGKTTLAKKVYKSVKHEFDCSAMVYVSQRPNISQLLMELAEQVGLEQEKCEENLEVNLHGYLQDKRYVIVFDDIWDSQAWEHMKICIPNNCTNGSKIIITSRKTKVASLIGTVSSLYKLEPLDEKYSWNLFKDLVFSPLGISNATSDFLELESLGKRIVEKNAGVPLAIEAVAGLLLGNETTEIEWNGVLERMGQDDDNCSRVLALSYKDLPTELKPCFLYFGFFPEDYEVVASDIINLWVAEGFVQGNINLEPEDVGQDFLNQLVSRNMVQICRRRFDGTVATCRVHDLWHTFCIMVATRSNFFNTHESIHQNNLSKTTRVRRVAISNNSMREHKSCYQTAKLRAIIYYNYYDFEREHVHDFFKRSKCLRVLRVGTLGLPSGFMEGVKSLTNLKYFGFSRGKGEKHHFTKAEFIKIPSTIGNLESLMTLNLSNACYENFPDEIWKMKQLRHIILNKASAFLSVRSYPYKKAKVRLSKLEAPLPNLQTLHVAPSNLLEAEFLSKLTNLRKLGIMLPVNSMIKVLSGVKPISDKLASLWLRCNHISDETPMDLSRYLCLRRLYLAISKSSLPEMPPNLVKLKLTLYEVEDDPMEKLKSLRKLKSLKLTVIGYKRQEMVCSGGPDAFLELEVLQLDPPASLEMFGVEQLAMPKLKRLDWRKQSEYMVRFEVPERVREKIFEVRYFSRVG